MPSGLSVFNSSTSLGKHENKTSTVTPLMTFKGAPAGSPGKESISGSKYTNQYNDNPRRLQRKGNKGWVSNCCNCIYDVIAAPLVKPSNREIDYLRLLRGGNGGWLLIAMIFAYWLFVGLKLALFTAVSSVPGEFFFLNCGNQSVDGKKTSSVSQHQLHAFTENDVNIFVQVLHSIIRNEGCRDGLKEKYNIATNYQQHRPVIKDDIIFNDLIHEYDFEPQDAQELIEMSRLLFSKSSHKVIKTYAEKGFIYLNDSLLEYCYYRMDYFRDILIFIVATLVIHTVFIVVRVMIRKYSPMCKCVIPCLKCFKFPSRCCNPRPVDV